MSKPTPPEQAPTEWRLPLPATERSLIPDEFVIRRAGSDFLIGYEALGERGLCLPAEVMSFLILSLVPLLDDAGKREVVKAMGFHVCDSCDDMRAGTWEEARDVGWVHGTFGPGDDGATLCAECHAGQGSE